MESRLPKPRAINLKQAITLMEANTKKTALDAPAVSTKGTSSLAIPSTNGLKTIGKSKTTLNMQSKGTNENKPPVKSFLTRSQTSATINRNPITSGKVAVKRLGTTMSTIETKRPTISRPVVTQRGGRPATTSVTTGKAVGTVAAAAAPQRAPPKPSKWDLKGRLELATSDLASLKEKHKQCGKLQSIVDELREKETATTIKVEELENTTATLSKELTTAKKNYTEILEKHEDLKTQLKESQESYTMVAESLKKCEETCESQKKILSEHANKVQNLEKNLSQERETTIELTERVRTLQTLLHDMDKGRRMLHNAIQELKGNIRVFCRVRPRLSKESSKNLCMINFIDDCTIEVARNDAMDTISCGNKSRLTKQEFSFDKVFPPNASQAEIFEELALLVQSALEGYNVCVFAYGQTGSGKTHTMEGGRDIESEGMIPRTVRHIFHEMKEFQLLGWEYRIEASFLEIYNEHIVDLLDSQQKTHDIRMADSKGHDLYVSNLQIQEINSPEELHDCLRTAQRNRAVAATFANERSSRSHSVARIRLIGTHAAKDEMSIGNLNLVDLAGSERLKGEDANRTTETKNINKSLANLGNVILALVKKQDHIPYRNSKLTHLLMPSLGGNSKTLMLLNVSPLEECFNETLNSLRFASTVNSCKTGNVKRSRQVLHNLS